MSRFFATGDTESSSSEESDIEEPIAARAGPKISSFARGAPESDDEDEKRVVKSKRQKWIDELGSVVKTLRNKIQIGDWGQAESTFKSLNDTLEKGKMMQADPPKVYLHALNELHDSAEAAYPSRKKLSKPNSKSLTIIRQNIKKMIREDEKLEESLAYAREHPDEADEADEPEEDGDGADDDDAPAAAAKDDSSDSETESSTDSEDDAPKKKSAAKKGDADDDDDWGSDWGTDSTDSDSEASADEGGAGFRYTAAMFLKKAPGADDKKTARKPKKPKPAQQKEDDKEDDEDDGFVLKESKAAKQKQKRTALFAKDEKVTHEAVLMKLAEIMALRGRKGVNVAEQMEKLRNLRKISDTSNLGAAISLKILLQIIAVHFDESSKGIAGHMPAERWHACHSDIMELLARLINDKEDVVTVSPDVPDDAENVSDMTKPRQILGDPIGLVERLDDEYIKMLQSMDPHKPEYVERLRDETVIYNLICACEKYADSMCSASDACRVKLRRVEHIYYKREYVHVPPSDEQRKSVEYYNAVSEEEEKDIGGLMYKLCTALYRPDSSDRIRARAMLCHIFHLALHDEWYRARDMMLMSHLQETISHSDISTQILHNRTMVQLGLCAFRKGLIWDAHSALHDVWTGGRDFFPQGRVRELLAQGLAHNRYQEKTQEDIKIERRRQTPFHMHINTDMIETIYLTTCMLLEIPQLARGPGVRNRMHSKPFRRQLNIFKNQAFSGPPEMTRDIVMAAAVAMESGDWRKCQEHIFSIKVWNLFSDKDTVLGMLSQKIREESLRTYLFVYSGFYESISLQTLSEMFELEPKKVHSIVSKMIISDELQASHDQPTQTIVIQKAEPTPLQSLALEFADKTNNFLETNERLLDMRTGNAFKSQRDWGSRRGGRSNFRGRGGGSRGGGRGRGRAPGASRTSSAATTGSRRGNE